MNEDLWERVARVLAGSPMANDLTVVSEWRAETPENEAEFVRLERVWNETGEVPSPSQRPTVESIQALSERRKAAVSRGAPRRRFLQVGAAAAAVLLLGIGVARWQSTPLDTPLLERTIGLSDGSVVRLAEGATLTFQEEDGRRVAQLNGRAFFAVHHDLDRPFEVVTPEGAIRVLGTRFEAHAQEDALSTTVLDGRVQLARGDSAVVVTPGQSSTTAAGDPHAPAQVGLERLQARWSNLLVFSDTPIQEALGQVERQFDVSVSYSSQEADGLVVTAWFESEPVGDVVDILCSTVGIECEVTP